MLERRNTVQITPFLLVQDIRVALDFYQSVLSFKTWQQGSYAYLERERAGIRLLEREAGDTLSGRIQLIYVDVLDLESAWHDLGPAISRLPQGRWTGPRETEYAMREFSADDPDGHRIVFGQGIGPNLTQWDYRNEF